MSGILGEKIGMTRILQDDGRVIPITVVRCEPNKVTQVKTTDKDGYPAIVLGFRALKKPMKTRKFRHTKEFRVKDENAFKKDDSVTLELFKDAKIVDITAMSKGKGFQGTVKRHNFSCGPRSHGSHFRREPGAIGARAMPGRVHKGKKLPGHMGNDQKTLKGVAVIGVQPEKNVIWIKGPVPGPAKGLIILRFPLA